MRNEKFKVLALLSWVCLLLTACLGDPRAKRIEEGEAVINIGSAPRTLDPSKATDVTSARAILCFMRGLTCLDENGKARPDLAESWKVSPDGMTWVFKLRPAKWTNGEPVTATDFQHAWINRVLEPKFKAEYAYQLFYIRGARAYYEARLKEIANKVEESEVNTGSVWVTALAADQLMVQLEAPTPFFAEVVAHHAYFPVCEKVDLATPNWADRAETYVGNGPFKMKSYELSKQIVGEKNPDYWDAAGLGLKRIVLRMIEKESTERIAFDNGEIDATQAVPRADLDELKTRPEFHSTPILSTYFLNLNCERDIFKDVRVRRALSLAIDRKAIVTSITRAGEKTAEGLVPPQLYTQAPGPYFPDHDPDQARKLLAEAGYPGGKGFPRLKYIFNTLEGHLLIAQVVQEQWKRELGILIDVESQEFRVCIDNRRAGKFDVARNGWVADFADPINFLEIFDSKSDNNDSHWKDTAYDELLNKARREANPAVRQAAYQAAERYLMDAMPAIPLYYYTQPYLAAERFSYRLNPMALFDAARLAWTPPAKAASSPTLNK
ncbi:peptide ABC transporter substrate-binding protein [bacterium]|nr:peptide ABC transporter substrate-binding protein [bacterium]